MSDELCGTCGWEIHRNETCHDAALRHDRATPPTAPSEPRQEGSSSMPHKHNLVQGERQAARDELYAPGECPDCKDTGTLSDCPACAIQPTATSEAMEALETIAQFQQAANEQNR